MTMAAEKKEEGRKANSNLAIRLATAAVAAPLILLLLCLDTRVVRGAGVRTRGTTRA